MATKSFFGRDSSSSEAERKRQQQRSGFLSGTPLGEPKAPAAKKPAKKTNKKKPAKRAKPPAKTGSDAIPGYKPRVNDAYERGAGGVPNLLPGQWVDPNHAYGSGAGDLSPGAQLRTGVGQNLAESDPRALFRHHLRQAGIPTDMDSPIGAFYNERFESDILPGYFQARNMHNMNLSLDAYLRGIEGGVAAPAVAPVGPGIPAGGRGGDPRRGPGIRPRPLHPGPGPRVVVDRVGVPPRPRPMGPAQGPVPLGRIAPGPQQQQRPRAMLPSLGGPQGPGGQQGGQGGNPFLRGLNPGLGAGLGKPQQGGLAKAVPKPKPKKNRPAVGRGPAVGRTGTSPSNPIYGTPGQNATAAWRRNFLEAGPAARRNTNGNIFGAGSTSWAAYR